MLRKSPHPPFSETTESAIQSIRGLPTDRTIGLGSDAALEEIGRLFAKYEIPIGMIGKLLALQKFDLLEFIVDDSSSMDIPIIKNPSPGCKKRWDEAQVRLKTMIEILAYIPTPTVVITFLNREMRIELERGKDPDLFIDSAVKEIDRVFANPPYGSTPILAALNSSFRKNGNKSVARYFFGDGVPDGGKEEISAISKLVQNRENPERSPITFFPCSDKEKDIEWMEQVEESAPFCAGLDDYNSEKEEILKDQGAALPYSYGLYLVSSLVAAMNPRDLDALDESTPIRRSVLNEIYGIQYSEPQYRQYFDEFMRAQANSEIRLIKDELWERSYHEFLHNPPEKVIEQEESFKARLKQSRK